VTETTFYFVRHGESEANAAQRFAGQSDSPLTDLGRRQAEAVAAALGGVHFDRVVSSDLSRARDTAEAIARRHGLAVETFRELREVDMGAAAGRDFEDARTHPDWSPEFARFLQWPEGESLDEALARMTATLDRLIRESPGKTICVVGHGGTTRILVSHFLGLLPRLYRDPSRRGGNTNITVVRTDGRTHRVDSLYESGHLDRPLSPEERMPEPGITDPDDAPPPYSPRR
jgi:broad specificity phosphatase PhoE